MMESLSVEMRRMIMEYLSNADLMKISLVNKLFNFEARSLMRDRDTLNARLYVPCRDIEPFVSALDKMIVVPWSGMKLEWSSNDHQALCRRHKLSNKKSDPNFLAILARLRWKRLSLVLHGRILAPTLCPTLQLLRKIFQNFCGVLEEISLDENWELLRFIQEVSNDSKFPSLKFFTINGLCHSEPSFDVGYFIKKLASRATNLEEVHLERSADFSENLLEGSPAVLVSNLECNPLTSEFAESVMGAVKLKKLALIYPAPYCQVPFTVVAKFNRIIPLILQVSFSTLTSLRVEAVFMLPLMRYGIALENVTDLKMFMDYHHLDRFQPQIITLLKRFDFTRIFPRLSKVVIGRGLIDISKKQVNQLVVQGNTSIFQDLQPNRTANIKSLHYYESQLTTDTTVPFLAEIFSSIDELSAFVEPGLEDPYRIIWEYWPNLKQLEITHCCVDLFTPWDVNLDSVFCGIFPEEMAQLRKQDDEFLRAVNIVPVMPSITSFQALRTLKLIYEKSHVSPKPVKPIHSRRSNLIFSNVTGLIAFQRCPELSVTVEADSSVLPLALHHMRP